MATECPDSGTLIRIDTMPIVMLPQASRRVLLGGLFALPLLAMPRDGARAQASGPAMALIKSVSEQLVAIVNGPGSVADKKPKLRRVVDTHVDVDEIAKFCLGRFWRTASPDQQKAYLAVFHTVLLNNISARIGEYVGVKIVLQRASTRDDMDIVGSTVERPNNPPAQVDWVVSKASGSPKIVDLIAEGTSMRLTQRSDYGAFLGRNNGNVQALIDALRQQVARNA